MSVGGFGALLKGTFSEGVLHFSYYQNYFHVLSGTKNPVVLIKSSL